MHEHIEPAPAHTCQIVIPMLDPAGHPLAAQCLAQRLGELAGVLHAFVSAQTEMAWLIYDPERFDLAEAIDTIEAMGYKAGAAEPRVTR